MSLAKEHQDIYHEMHLEKSHDLRTSIKIYIHRISKYTNWIQQFIKDQTIIKDAPYFSSIY